MNHSAPEITPEQQIRNVLAEAELAYKARRRLILRALFVIPPGAALLPFVFSWTGLASLLAANLLTVLSCIALFGGLTSFALLTNQQLFMQEIASRLESLTKPLHLPALRSYVSLELTYARVLGGLGTPALLAVLRLPFVWAAGFLASMLVGAEPSVLTGAAVGLGGISVVAVLGYYAAAAVNDDALLEFQKANEADLKKYKPVLTIWDDSNFAMLTTCFTFAIFGIIFYVWLSSPR